MTSMFRSANKNCMALDVIVDVAAASVFCAPGITLQKDPGQASSSKQHKGDVCTALLLYSGYEFYRFCCCVDCRIRHTTTTAAAATTIVSVYLAIFLCHCKLGWSVDLY